MRFINTLEETNNQLSCSNECTALPLLFESNTALTSMLLLYNMGRLAINEASPANVLIIPDCGLLRLPMRMRVVCFLFVSLKILYIPP